MVDVDSDIGDVLDGEFGTRATFSEKLRALELGGEKAVVRRGVVLKSFYHFHVGRGGGGGPPHNQFPLHILREKFRGQIASPAIYSSDPTLRQLKKKALNVLTKQTEMRFRTKRQGSNTL